MAEIEEIQRHTSQKVYLNVYGGTADAAPTVTITGDSLNRTTTANPETPDPSSGINDRWSVTLTMADTQNEGDIAVTWNFAMSTVAVTKTDYLSVYSPILSDGAIKEIHPNATPDEIAKVEKAVRHIIQAHCGQEFGNWVGSKTVRGKDSIALYLPARLITLTSINGLADNVHYQTEDDGWTLYSYPWGIPQDAYYLTGGVIHDPYLVNYGVWDPSTFYDIVGEWGYRSTPAPVAEAAKLLVNDYACGDNQYRDRFLTSMTAADWRIQFNDGAFTNTGNVRANQLLQEFVVKGSWVAI